MVERHGEALRANDDWYVEPAWVVDSLYKQIALEGKIHDPCAGIGTIPDRFRELGFETSGADKIDRGKNLPVRDFFFDENIYDNIVTNPPYKSAMGIIHHGLARVRTGGLICALVNLKFLSSQQRYKNFTGFELESVVVLSRRPSIPPGKFLESFGESARGGGSIDFAWVVFRAGGRRKAPTIHWSL